jgi:hypothetical protein
MKKIISFLLIFIFFYSIIGFYLNFELEQFRIKEEIKEKIIHNLPYNKLTLIKVSSVDKGNFTWTEYGKEFRFNSNMFDVVRIKIQGGKTYYYCFDDEKESNLFIHLDKLVKEQTDNSRSRTTQKKQHITYFFHETLLLQCPTKKPVYYFTSTSKFISICSEVLSPPPKAFSFC